jgi:hypothetical protein
MPKKSKTSKNDIKQKQTQKQIVNVNINQTKKTTTKRKPREQNKPPQKQILYQYGSPLVGRPGDNLYYNSPPTVAQIIPAMGGETSSLIPPNNTSIENVLKSIKEKTDKIMRPQKKLIDSGTQEIFNMEPKKKLEIKPEQLITAPRGSKIQIPKQPPFKLTGEIVQRKNTDMQTVPKQRKILTDSGTNELFNIPSETRDYKTILNAANKEMKSLVKKVEKLSKKKETKPIETQTEPNIKAVSSVATEMPKIQTSSINTQTTTQKEKKLIFNPKKIEKQKQLKKYKDLIPGNLLTSSRKVTNFMNVKDNFQPFLKSEKDKLLKEEKKQKVPAILAAAATMPPAFKPYSKIKPHIPSLIRRKQKEVFEPKSLLNVADLNTTNINNVPLKYFTKMTDIFNTATKSDKNMNKFFPELEDFKKEDKSANVIKSFIKNNIKRKKDLKESKAENKMIKSLADTFDVSQYKMKPEYNKRKEKVIKKDQQKDLFKQATKSDKNMNDILQEIKNLTQPVELTQPIELFGGTRSGTAIHQEPTAPPQPLFGKDIDKTINDNFDKIKEIYKKEPKSYAEVIQANKDINVYKQNINRIKKRNGKSILSSDQIQLKEETLKEIKKLKDTYNKIYKEFYKTQQPKKGRKAKA